MNHLHPVFVGVKSVLVVLSSRAMAFDLAALRNLITLTYPGTAVFFVSASGDPLGVEAPSRVDLVIDFTEPHARQSPWFAFRMRAAGRFVVGRAAGWFYRRMRYDRVYDQSVDSALPSDYLESEAFAQRRVLELAGVSIKRQGGVTPDLSKDIGSRNSPSLSR